MQYFLSLIYINVFGQELKRLVHKSIRQKNEKLKGTYFGNWLIISAVFQAKTPNIQLLKCGDILLFSDLATKFIIFGFFLYCQQVIWRYHPGHREIVMGILFGTIIFKVFTHPTLKDKTTELVNSKIINAFAFEKFTNFTE